MSALLAREVEVLSLSFALRERFRAKEAGEAVAKTRAWKLFGMIPAMLLHRPRGSGSIGRHELIRRADVFAQGRWQELIASARRAVSVVPTVAFRGEAEERDRRGRAAQGRVERGQVSRARQELTGAALAPKTRETLEELQCKRSQRRVQEIPVEVMDFMPQRPVTLNARVFAASLRGAPNGSSPGPGGCSYEMLKVCFDDGELLQLLTAAAEDFARASVPQEIFRAFQKAHMTALAKKDGGVRGIATGTSFRRLVAKSMARHFAKEVESVCAPFQFALSTRAGTDCVGHAVRAMTDAHSTSTVLSLDGIGAYDHVFRSAMLSKLHSEPRLHGLLPFVRAMYSDPSRYSWRDAAGTQHVILQCEGGEQGDPLMPLLFSLAIHDALAETKDALENGEELLAFLDDIYAISEPGRTRAVYNKLAEKLATKAGIHLHTGKTRVWNQEGVCPPNLEDLGPDVWSSRGVKILGREVEERKRFMGRHTHCARSAVRLADLVTVRGPTLSPSTADPLSTPV